MFHLFSRLFVLSCALDWDRWYETLLLILNLGSILSQLYKNVKNIYMCMWYKYMNDLFSISRLITCFLLLIC